MNAERTRAMWLPKFACPECRNPGLAREEGLAAFVCQRCGSSFDHCNGVYRFLSPRRAEAAEPFHRQYRLVREREGYRAASPGYYRSLPSVPRGDPHAAEWRIRRESLVHLERHALGGRHAPLHALDLGAGSGWLSHRLAAEGHRVVAVDRLDDEADGLRACRHYQVEVALVQADFDALPFGPGQFDLIVFDGSLHYAVDPGATLGEAGRMLAPGGTLAVMDSPMFASDGEGQVMVTEQLRRLEIEYGLDPAVRPGLGFLTFAALERAAGRLGLRGRFFPSRGPVAWRLRRRLARLRIGRAPAAFGVWVAR
jgi:SAM-dependent methyltransferase